jgi:hypothetical protein
MGTGGKFVRVGRDSPEEGPQPNLDNGGRWHHVASEREIARAMGDQHAQIIECPIISMTFVCSHVYGCIVRAGALGGDVRNIEGGWQYLTNIDLRADVAELVMLSEISVTP